MIDYREVLIDSAPYIDTSLVLALPGVNIEIKSNANEILRELQLYFRHLPHSAIPDNPTVEVIVVEGNTIDLNLPWRHWAREPGKCGKKDAFLDIEGARLLFKVRTGMVFYQSLAQGIARGPCLANLNQIINFINNQYMNHLQQRDWLICHAAAVSFNGKVTAFAGFSGGGKSTSMLHLLNHEGINFLTNDRLFIKKNSEGVMARGVPKLPRVNPGTIMNNPRLNGIFPEQTKARIRSLPENELWNLEEKYDVDVLDIYGDARIEHQGVLERLVILNWNRASDNSTQFNTVSLENNLHLVDAIKKSPGPFYQDENGIFLKDFSVPNANSYIQSLTEIEVIEVAGRTDFAALTYHMNSLLRH